MSNQHTKGECKSTINADFVYSGNGITKETVCQLFSKQEDSFHGDEERQLLNALTRLKRNIDDRGHWYGVPIEIKRLVLSALSKATPDTVEV